ncbi:Uncharacterized protein APZ42_023478 [Daphnia magna]|uniref:Uncharacterized protein n=1 Tax=Daphnia magna TaxID=35525 RepID=A0A0P6EC86_9CRUS|nr:Uncharacterized protein APZ42_023478 [Daphnia magna]
MDIKWIDDGFVLASSEIGLAFGHSRERRILTTSTLVCNRSHQCCDYLSFFTAHSVAKRKHWIASIINSSGELRISPYGLLSGASHSQDSLQVCCRRTCIVADECQIQQLH